MADSTSINNSHNILSSKKRINDGIQDSVVLQLGEFTTVIPYKASGFIYGYFSQLSLVQLLLPTFIPLMVYYIPHFNKHILHLGFCRITMNGFNALKK